jgi:4-amino-4-deoxy-L-arabinose transferase-like glycosyltransferase
LRNDWAIYHPIVPVGTKISTLIFGIDLWAIRLPTMICGILLIPITYWAGSNLFEYRVGLIAAALVAVAFPLVVYSGAVRGYAYGNLFLIGAWALVPYVCRSKNVVGAILFAALCALAAFSVKSMIFGVVFCCLYFALDTWRQDNWKIEKRAMIFGLALGGLISVMILFLYSPYWLVNNFSDLINSSGYPALGGNSTTTPMELLINQGAGLWQQWTADVPLPVLGLLVLGVVVALISNRRAQHLVGAILVSHLPVLFIVGAHVPPPRIWQYLLPVVFIIAASGIVRILSVVPAALQNSMVASILAIFLSLSGVVTAIGDNSELVSYREKPYQKASLQGTADILIKATVPDLTG